MPHIRLALLGVPTIERDGVAVHVDTRKAIALLAYLAVSDGPQSRDAIASLLWCDLDTSSARAALRRTLSTLKSVLPSSALASDRRIIHLQRDTLDIDLDRFQAALKSVRNHGHALRQGCSECLPILANAVGLYRGDFLSGFSLRDGLEFEEWQLLHTEALRRDLTEALEGVVAAFSAAGRLDDAIVYAQRWLALDPLQEAAHRALMQLYSRSGQRPAALQQYRECVRVLEEELAVPPVEETTRLYQSIKEREESPPTPSAPMAPSAGQPGLRQLPLTGRSREWDALVRAFEAMRRGGHIVALEGEAGIGKTRLLDGLIEHARAAGSTTLTARCFEGEMDLAYAPVIQLLRAAIGLLQRSDALDHVSPRDLSEVARLLPEVDALRPTVVASQPQEIPGAQTRFLESICRLLLAAGRVPAGSRPLILALDDLQWADVASLECLVYLLRRLEGNCVGVALAWRGEGFPPMHVVRRIIVEAQRAGHATVLSLERLDRVSVLQLVEAVAPAGLASHHELGEWLYEETEGLPLFLGEYLTAIAGGSLDRSPPLGVHELLLSRLASVKETGWQFLAAAAVIGRSFDFDTLREISGRDEEMAVTALEELGSQGLVREVESGAGEALTYDFSHDKLRTLVYDRTSMARRRLLHRRVAEALASRSRNQHNDSLAGQIARHYHLAGLPSEAAAYFYRAGEHARALFANREALAHYEAALALGHPAVAELQEALGDLHALLGEYQSAAARYELAATLSKRRDLARIEHKLGSVHHRWGEWELAESYFEEALSTLGEGESAEGARINADWSMATYHRGHTEKAARLARTALELADEAGDVRALAQAHNMLGILESSSGHGEAARDHLSRSLALAEELPDPGARVAALHNLAYVCWRDDDVEEAHRLTSEALSLCSAQGDRHREAALHNTMADLLHAGGAAEEAMTHLKQAVTIYAEIGVEAGALRPEVWKLTEW